MSGQLRLFKLDGLNFGVRMRILSAAGALPWVFPLMLVLGCTPSGSVATEPLSADNLNLIFVVSPDLAFQASGDVDPETANLTPQGLNRSLLLASYLKQQVMGARNVNGITVLEPMSHLQTANKYPDMAAIGFVQPFALLNQITLPVDAAGSTCTANSYPINVSYTTGAVPDGVVVPSAFAPDCNGLVFKDTKGDNGALVDRIIKAKRSGFYVFSAPWETTRALLEDLENLEGYDLDLPVAFEGTNRIYAISIASSEGARLVAFDSGLEPASTYPALPSPVASSVSANLQQAYFSTSRTAGVDGAVSPVNINTHQTTYIIRHAEAHPDPAFHFEDGSLVGAGEWRALDLPVALRGKMSPQVVYSVDPAVWYSTGYFDVSYTRPSLTVLPYVIAQNLPYYLASSVNLMDPNTAQATSDFFFRGGNLSNQVSLVAWESTRIKPFINALLDSYGATTLPRLPVAWPGGDYETIWRVVLDAQGNVTVDNGLCEGIDSAQLPVTAPAF